MSFINSIVSFIKDQYHSRNRKISISSDMYNRLQEEVGSEDEVNRLVRSMIAKRFIQMREDEENNQKEAIHLSQLKEYYIGLDKFLYSTLNCNVKIGITKELEGKEPSYCNYLLKDYKLSMVDNYLLLVLERNGESYPISFNGIYDIKYNNNSGTLKTWIYMPYPVDTWRFYLDYDPQKYNNVPTDTGKLTI